MEKLSVDIQSLADQFNDLLAQAGPGDEVVVTEGGQPKAILTPIAPNSAQPTQEITVMFLGEPKTIVIPAADPNSNKKRRIAGLGIGKIEILPDFDTPLPDEFWLGDS